MVENFTKYFKWPPQVSDDKKKLITKHYPFHDSVISTFSLTRLGIGHEVWFWESICWHICLYVEDKKKKDWCLGENTEGLKCDNEKNLLK